MKPVAVVIPCYKNELDANETLSLRQCYNVIGHYDIVFVCPKHMENQSFHQDNVDKASFIFLKDKHFLSIESYNHLMLSSWLSLMCSVTSQKQKGYYLSLLLILQYSLFCMRKKNATNIRSAMAYRVKLECGSLSTILTACLMILIRILVLIVTLITSTARMT